tara:strand:+ start:72 stop:1454 length:1383 start_codon:yes stop_codon:yes gene_type:complete
MAKPTLTPAQTTSTIVLPSKYDVPDRSGDAASQAAYAALTDSFPFGVYSNSANWFQADGISEDPAQVDTFLSGSADQVAYTYRKLGGDVLDIELTKEQVFAAYEEAVLEYSYILNIHQTKNILSNSLGNTTGSFNEDGMITEAKDANNPVINNSSHMSLKYPRFDFSYARRVTEGISEEAGVGGDTTVYSASIDIVTGKQDYDLQKELADNVTFQNLLNYDPNTPGSEPQKFLIKKVFYRTPKAMWRFYGHHNGLNTAGNLSSYGQYADDSTYELIPTWHNKLQAQAFEEALNVRVSHYSYELRNNKLRLFPVPHENVYPDKIWVEFIYPRDTWKSDISEGNTGMDGVNNMNTVPLQNIPYKNINSIGKQWIRRFALSLSKEMLGLVRSKFSSIPIPGNDISMNGDALVSSGKEEQAALREELKTTLDELTYSKLMEGDAEVVENSNRVMVKVPTAIFTG